MQDGWRVGDADEVYQPWCDKAVGEITWTEDKRAFGTFGRGWGPRGLFVVGKQFRSKHLGRRTK